MFFSSRRFTVRCFLQLLNRVCKLLATNESGRICKCRMPVLCQRTYNYVTGRLEDSERQNDEKTSRETAHSRSCETIFCHSAVLSLAAVLLRKVYYYMANPVLGKRLCSDWFFLGQDFAVRTVSMETVQPVYFCFGEKPANSKFATKRAKKKKL